MVKIEVVDSQGNSDTAVCLILVTEALHTAGLRGLLLKNRLCRNRFLAATACVWRRSGFRVFRCVRFTAARTDVGPLTGKISGTPTAAGTYSFTVKVVDDNGTSDTDSCSIVIRGPSIVLTCTSCGSTAKVGVYYSQQLKVSGGTSPYTFSIVSGSLPPGLQLDSFGKITGKPTTAGTYRFKAKVDSHGSYDTVWCTIEVVRRCW